jgi:hypothetical protein
VSSGESRSRCHAARGLGHAAGLSGTGREASADARYVRLISGWLILVGYPREVRRVRRSIERVFATGRSCE